MRSRRSKALRRLTLSALLSALGAVLMVLGSFVEVLDLSVCALASLIMIFAYVELGAPYTWLIWLVTSAVTALVAPASTVWMLYLLIFGVYPLLKGYIERVRRGFWLPLKLLVGNLLAGCAALTVVFLFKLPLVELSALPFEIPAPVVYSVLWVGVNLCIILYDYFLTVMARFYMTRLRQRFSGLLK